MSRVRQGSKGTSHTATRATTRPPRHRERAAAWKGPLPAKAAGPSWCQPRESPPKGFGEALRGQDPHVDRGTCTGGIPVSGSNDEHAGGSCLDSDRRDPNVDLRW